MELFERFGLEVGLRWLHVLAGITWIGLLYYFNLVQVPAFAEYGDEARARNIAIDRVARRALWWFRWSALVTAILGLLITGAAQNYYDDFFSKAGRVSILIGMILGLTMLGNVWSVIWPQQKIVLANAANLVAGGEADPGAAAAGRKALLASRQNTIFSVPMLWFMVATAHFYGFGDFDNTDLSAGKAWAFIIISLAIALVLELNALGIIGGTGPGPLKWPYESHKNAIITAFVLWAVLWILSEILLQV